MKETYNKLGFQVIAICADRPELVGMTTKDNKIEFAMYSDSEMEAARGFRLAYVLSKELQKVYKEYDVDIMEKSGQTHQQLPVPGIFLLSKDRVVQHVFYNPNEKIRPDPEVVLAKAKELAANTGKSK